MGDGAAQHQDRGKLSGLNKRKVIRELALGELSQSALAEKYDVTPAAITMFKKRNAEAIAAVRADADNEFAGILIAEKVNRVQMYEELLHKALVPMPKVSNKGTLVTDPETGEYVYEVDVRAAMQALKSVAEEMGQLPNRVTIGGELSTTTTYRVEGVTPEDLT